jgi:hypothetical protein
MFHADTNQTIDMAGVPLRNKLSVVKSGLLGATPPALVGLLVRSAGKDTEKDPAVAAVMGEMGKMIGRGVMGGVMSGVGKRKGPAQEIIGAAVDPAEKKKKVPTERDTDTETRRRIEIGIEVQTQIDTEIGIEAESTAEMQAATASQTKDDVESA